MISRALRRASPVLRAVGVLVAALALGGCIPLKQPMVTGGEQYDHFGYHDAYLWSGGYGLLQVGPSNVVKAVAVVDAESCAVGPGGERYGVESEPHPPDLDQTPHPYPGEYADVPTPYVRDRIYLANAKGRRIRSWRDGKWTFVFVLDTPRGRETREFAMTLGTFHYNPLVHGPPN